jgi:hypothetical protein
MFLRKLALATAAGTLAILPVAAQAMPVERTSAPVVDQSELAGSGEFLNAIIIIAIAALGMAALLISDDDDRPVSP